MKEIQSMKVLLLIGITAGLLLLCNPVKAAEINMSPSQSLQKAIDTAKEGVRR